MHLIQLSVPLLAAALALPQNPTPTVTTIAPAAGRQAAAPTGIAAAKLWDQAGGLLEASSTPTLGMLYPLSDRLFVDPASGRVGVGTTAPQHDLHVKGQLVAGASSFVSGTGAAVLGGESNSAIDFQALVCGGASNQADGNRAFVGGGQFNQSFGNGAVVAGGSGNGALADVSTIGGGSNNTCSMSFATVSGGSFNSAGGAFATVPGGALCVANGDSSFAAGQRAQALHDGSFVWADGSLPTTDFNSKADNQFLVRADGGVGIGTNTPGSQLDVAGIVRSSGPSGGSFAAYNPNDPGVSASFSWLNDVARIRVGGSGSGAQNGLDIQTVSNTSLLRIAGNGDTTAKGQMRATAFVQTSDARLKTDVRELEGALDTVRALRGVRFRWDRERRPDAEEGERVGFLAQEVREVVPEAVRESPDGMLAVSYAELVPVLVEALQEQEAEIADLGAKVAAQQNEIKSLRELEARVLALESPSRDPQ